MRTALRLWIADFRWRIVARPRSPDFRSLRPAYRWWLKTGLQTPIARDQGWKNDGKYFPVRFSTKPFFTRFRRWHFPFWSVYLSTPKFRGPLCGINRGIRSRRRKSNNFVPGRLTLAGCPGSAGTVFTGPLPEMGTNCPIMSVKDISEVPTVPLL